ncbi:MAG: PilT protein domain protein [Actinomycetia bacterium]|nr:PilT protein domain protein [Actinomycetes bacterium]
MAVAEYLVDESALARLDQPVVFARLAPLVEAGLVATCAVIELEILYSTQRHADYEAVRVDRREGYEWLPMADEVWDRALDVQRQLSAQGQLRAVGIPDLLIAATAERHAVTLVHYDSDFDVVAAVTGQPTEWVVPRGSVP